MPQEPGVKGQAVEEPGRNGKRGSASSRQRGSSESWAPRMRRSAGNTASPPESGLARRAAWRVRAAADRPRHPAAAPEHGWPGRGSEVWPSGEGLWASARRVCARWDGPPRVNTL